MENDNFYKCGGIHTDFDKIKKFIDDKQEEIINYPSHEQTTPTPIIGEELIFEQVNEKKGILMQLFYKIMIEKSNTEENNEFMNFLRENYLNDPKYKDILSQIVDVPDIPVELLSKYYARIYTINGNFYKNMKKELLKGNEENYKTYLPFIKTLFEGTRKRALKTCFQIDLYSAQWLAQMEIDNFKNMSQIGKGNFVKQIYFSKSFISFSKDENIAKNFYNNTDKNAIITLIGDKKEMNLLTHADIEDISVYKNEKEVLFFPFSTFEIINIEIDPSNPEKYKIKLKYLAQYIEELKNDKKFYNSRERIPDTRFKALIEKTGLIKQDKLNMEIKDVFKNYDNYTENYSNRKCNKKWWLLSLLSLGLLGLLGLLKVKSKDPKEKCQKNYYLYNSKCLPCSPGYYSNTGSIVCSRCPYGQSSYGNGTDCFNCPEGTFSDYYFEECTTCSAGYYAKEGSSSCSSCPGGTYSGAKAGKCLKCSADYYSDGGSSECSLCKEGTFSKEGDSDCSDCPPGTFSNISGATFCSKCPAGTSPNYQKTSCNDCQKGYFANITGSSECIECPDGSYSDKEGSISCITCHPGTASNYQKTSCNKCSKGYYSNKEGANDCIQCPAGSITDKEGSISCITCPVRTYEYNRQYCYPCSIGTYSNKIGATECIDCPEGYYNTEEGSTNCTICPVGTYEYLRESCQKCSIGTYSNEIGATRCIDCPEGYYNTEEGSTNCTICPVGTYEYFRESCQKCSPGYYSNITGATECIQCPAGYYNTEEGSTKCKICPAGYCSDEGSLSFYECS